MGNVHRLDEHLQDLFRRMAFNILIANTDDHEKNHAVTCEFIKRAPVVNLSDAYDVRRHAEDLPLIPTLPEARRTHRAAGFFTSVGWHQACKPS